MSEIDWNKMIEFTVPILVAVIGALVAIYNVRQNIKLSHKLKKKEELREIFVELVMSLKKIAEITKIALQGSDRDEILKVGLQSKETSEEILNKILLLSLYYDDSDKDYEDISVLFLDELSKINDNIKNNNKIDTNEINVTKLIKGFKKLYDNIKI